MKKPKYVVRNQAGQLWDVTPEEDGWTRGDMLAALRHVKGVELLTQEEVEQLGAA